MANMSFFHGFIVFRHKLLVRTFSWKTGVKGIEVRIHHVTYNPPITKRQARLCLSTCCDRDLTLPPGSALGHWTFQSEGASIYESRLAP